MDKVSQLFYLYGIGYEYTKYTGEHVIFKDSTRHSALAACGVDGYDEIKVSEAINEIDVKPWIEVVEPVFLFKQSEGIFKLKLEKGKDIKKACLILNSKNIRFELDITKASITGNYHFLGRTYLEYSFFIPNIKTGYHCASVFIDAKKYDCEIWSIPNKSFEIKKPKCTGISVQLYTLNSRSGLGFGDFLDLEELIIKSSSVGLDYILLNPLHMLFENQFDRASPYSPNDRTLLNPLYIAIEKTDIFKVNISLQTTFQHAVNKLKQECENTYINYSAVCEIKFDLLKQLYHVFINLDSNDELQLFNHFKDNLDFESANLSDMHIYWQFIAQAQLKQCQILSKERGMSIGLINDLAVGCAADSREYETYKHLYTEGVTVGAPPDPWAENGQDWGLPALSPQKMKDKNYKFFKNLIRRNIENVGALRIDHVMAIRRLWWSINNNESNTGCYVYYPFDHLLAILKIESVLHNAPLIGEDLGVVPNEVREAMSESNITGNSLFYFEKDAHDNFLNIESFRKNVMLMIANHDVPPFTAWWLSYDLKLKHQYHLINEQQLEIQLQYRQNEKSKLLLWLENHEIKDLTLKSKAMTIYSEVLRLLASSSSALLCIQLDDLDEQTLPVNIPGTDNEYPNWRRRLKRDVDSILENSSPLLASVISIRNKK